jgi:NAD(P)H dehydrogenase (quinone)
MVIYVVFCSVNGHVHGLAEAVAEGARSVDGATVELFQTPGLTVIDSSDNGEAREPRLSFDCIPVIAAGELVLADAIIFGTPTRFGMMAAEMRNLLDQTAPLWDDGALIGKVGSVFTSTTTQQGGQETTLTSFHAALLHLGMIIVGVPYCERRLLSVGTISGRNPYGASIVVDSNNVRLPNETEIGIARFQGQHVAEVTDALLRGRAHSTRLPRDEQ